MVAPPVVVRTAGYARDERVSNRSGHPPAAVVLSCRIGPTTAVDGVCHGETCCPGITDAPHGSWPRTGAISILAGRRNGLPRDPERSHRTHDLPAEGGRPDERRVAEFYGQYGVDPQEFLKTMNSFGIDFKVRRAAEHMQASMRASKVLSTPSVVINGRYLVRGRTYDDMLRIATYLIEKEHSNGAQERS